jgi:DNA polymerase III subunit delta
LRLPTGKPGRAGGAAIEDFVERLGPELMLLVVTPKLDRAVANAKWVKALETRGANLTVWPVGARDLPGWIAERMRRAELEPDRQAVAMIADRVEGNLLAAAQEVEKLRLLLGAGKVSADDVNRAVADSSRYDVYQLADAAVAGEARRAMRILAGLRAEGVEPVIVVWSLTRELRTLARLSELLEQRLDLGTALQKAQVWRSRQALVRSALGRHTGPALLRLLKASGHADAAAKGQRREDPWQLAADIVLQLASGGRRAA